MSYFKKAKMMSNDDNFEQKEKIQDVEALKAHIFNLSDNHMEQVVMLVRGWMRNDETAKA